MAPLPFARIWRSSCFMQVQTPRRLIAVTRSKFSADEPAEGVDRALDEGGDLGLVGHVARDAERLMIRGGQLVGGGAERVLVDAGEHDGGAGCGEGPALSRPMPEPAPAIGHGRRSTLIASRWSIAR
jgi:hypothetical protein